MSKKTIAISLLVAGVAVLLFLYFVKPGGDNVYPKCPTRYFTGLNCPGCGTLRAVHSMLHLDFKSALKFNLLTVLLTPFLLYGLAAYFAKDFFDKKWPDIFEHKSILWTIIVLIIVFTVLRNIPIWPFLLLKS